MIPWLWFSMIFVPFIVSSQQMDRTQEVLVCEAEILEGNTHEHPVFFNLTFDEVCSNNN